MSGLMEHPCENCNLLDALQQEVDSLRTRLAASEQRAEQLKLSSDIAIQAGEGLSRVASVALAEGKQMLAERNQYRAEVADLMPRLDADAMTISNLARERDQAQAQAADLEQMIDSVREACHSRLAETVQAQQERDQAQAQVGELRTVAESGLQRIIGRWDIPIAKEGAWSWSKAWAMKTDAEETLAALALTPAAAATMDPRESQLAELWWVLHEVQAAIGMPATINRNRHYVDSPPGGWYVIVKLPDALVRRIDLALQSPPVHAERWQAMERVVEAAREYFSVHPMESRQDEAWIVSKHTALMAALAALQGKEGHSEQADRV